MTPLLEHPTLRDIHQAQERLKAHIRRTPLLRAEKMETTLGCEVYLKPEMLQITGAFKIRGALNKALSLPREAIANGIIATSSGNHARGWPTRRGCWVSKRFWWCPSPPRKSRWRTPGRSARR